jgi:hypothetical protein
MESKYFKMEKKYRCHRLKSIRLWKKVKIIRPKSLRDREVTTRSRKWKNSISRREKRTSLSIM